MKFQGHEIIGDSEPTEGEPFYLINPRVAKRLGQLMLEHDCEYTEDVFLGLLFQAFRDVKEER